MKQQQIPKDQRKRKGKEQEKNIVLWKTEEVATIFMKEEGMS
jgi:hypothetical protein